MRPISFHVFIAHVGFLFFELPIHSISLLFYLVVSLFLIDLDEIIYSAYYSLMLCKCHLPVCSLSFNIAYAASIEQVF